MEAGNNASDNRNLVIVPLLTQATIENDHELARQSPQAHL